MLLRTVSDMERLIVDNLHRIRQIPFDVIVHPPRSGTIPAYDKLIMGPWKTKQERKGEQAGFKAYHYRRGQYKLFIEPSEEEAVRMRYLVEKPIWSIETMNYTGFHD